MDPFKNQIDDRTSYKSLDEQFYEARLDRDGINQSDWPSQIDRAAIDVCYGVALGTTDSAFDHGGTIGKNDFGGACGLHYVDGLRALAGSQSDLPRLIDEYDARDLGNLAFRLNELRVELEKLELGDSDISDLNRTTEALVEKLITQGSSGDLARQPLQKPEAVADLLYQLFSDPAVTTYANVLIDGIAGGTETSIGSRSLLEHLDRPQMVTPLWDHQQEGIKEWVQADTQGYVNMATATGKTVLGLAAIAHKFGELHPADTDSIPPVADSVEGKARILIVAGQDLLLKQWQSEFDEHLNIPRSRTVQSQTADVNVIELKWGDIEFRTAQELLNNDIQDTYDLVILDEAHRYSSGTRGSRGWRDLFEELIDATDSILAMSGSIDDEWLGDDSVKNALEANLKQCIEFTIDDARSQNVIADFRWDVCYAASTDGGTVESIATSTKPLAAVYNSKQHKFEPHELSEAIPEAVPDQFETLRDLRSFAHTKEGKQARDNNDAFDRFATAAFSRKPKRWQLSPPAETIGQLLEEHLPERKCIVLVQSYAQAEAIGDHLKEQYGKELITVPEQATDAPYDSISEFKDATKGVLIGPGEVLGVGVDLPNADVAINLAKGGVNASLIQRIGRILRNPTGDKKAHFYQVVAIASNPEARLPGEDGRRLLRRASEFRALGSRFREHPGFVVADSTASEIVRVLETHGSQAKIKDDRPTEEMVGDDVARRFLDEITIEIDSKVGESFPYPVLPTYWKPESLSPGTLPVRKSVQELDQNEQSVSKPKSKSDLGTESDSKSESEPVSSNDTPDKPATVVTEVTDPAGKPVSDASVAIENPSPIDEATTNTDGIAAFNLSVYTDDVCVFISKEGYESYFTSISVTEGEQRVAAKLTHQTEQDVGDNPPPKDSQEGKNEDESEAPSYGSPSREDVIAELRKVNEKVQTYPMRSDFIKEADLEIGAVYDHFESWNDAYEASATDSGIQEVPENSSQDERELVDDSQSGDAHINDADSTSDAATTHPSREEVIAEIRDIDAKSGNIPMRSDFIEQSAMDIAHVDEHFRSWSKAYRASESPTEQDIVDEISRLAAELGPSLTKAQFEDHSYIDIRCVYEKFESWRDAVQAADSSETSLESTGAGTPSTEGTEEESPTGTSESPEHQHTDRTATIEARDQPTSPSDPESSEEVDLAKRDLLIELVALTQELQRVPTESEINQFGKFKYRDYVAKFGDLYEAAQQAGIIEDSVTRTGFFASEQTDVDSTELIDDTNKTLGTEDTGLGNRDETSDGSYLSWIDAVRQELGRYHRKKDGDIITLQQFYEFSEHRLSNRFPNNDNVRAKIRQLFQRLRDHGEVEFLDGIGEYRINMSAETQQDGDNIGDSKNSNEGERPHPIELIIELQDIDDAVKGYPLTTEVRKEGKYDPEQYYAEFGSWEDALEAAGINKEKRLITEIQRVAQVLGREPTTTDMGKHSPYSTGTHSGYFGSWSKALKLANVAEVIESVESTDCEQSKNSTQASTPFQDPHEASFDPQDPVNELHNQISGVGQATCGKLHKAGYETVRDLRTASKDEITAIKHVGQTKAETILNFISVDASCEYSSKSEQIASGSVPDTVSHNNPIQENNNRSDEETESDTQPSEKDRGSSKEGEETDSSDLVESIMQDIENQFEDK